MNILIAYDGSDCSKVAVQDLPNAGLPTEGVNAKIVTAGEFVYPVVGAFEGRDPNIPLISYSFEKAQQLTEYAMEDAEEIAGDAERQIAQMFPTWKIEREPRLHSPASAILELAKSSETDLIVMGSHGRTFFPRLFLGSVSLRVSSEAACSVRIVKKQSRITAPTILLAFDDTEGSRAALRGVLHRNWPPATSVHLVIVADVMMLAEFSYMTLATEELISGQTDRESRLEHMMHDIERELKKKFLSVTSRLVTDVPTHGILEEADLVNADMIFMGSHGHSKLHKLMLGSVARGVSARSEATVEIVRERVIHAQGG